ncbi:MAG: MFS transporter [Bacteroidales bacterium]|nr:MFS transporter [Bacteroidales bacterium]
MSEKNLFKNIFVSLKSRNYRLYFTGQGVSLIGTWMQNVAMSWLVYRLTGSVLLLGVVAFTSQFPTFVLSPFAGVITDKFSRRNIMLIAQILFMLHALGLAFLTLTEVIQVWHIIFLSIVLALFQLSMLLQGSHL